MITYHPAKLLSALLKKHPCQKSDLLMRQSTINLEQLQDSGRTCYLAPQDGYRGINWSSNITSSNSQTDQQPNPENCTFNPLPANVENMVSSE